MAKITNQGSLMYLKLDGTLSSKFPGLSARILTIRGVSIEVLNPALETFKQQIFEEATGKWNLEELKENRIFRAYRDFFWKVKVDPTKTRPASEALLRRILRGNPLPTINTLVDAYNLASVSTSIPFGAFDFDRIKGELLMREALPGEEFLGIGMDAPIRLIGGEAIIQDDERLIAVYPYRDAEYSKVTISTRNLLLMVCGVPGVGRLELEKAEMICVDYITRFCGGAVN
jgi:DNA/RNA-binding domain of Phe-tRNA-synthetase-like protein